MEINIVNGKELQLLFKGTLGFGALKIVNMVLMLAVSVALARGFSPADFGKYSLVLAVVHSIVMLACLGVPQLLVRDLARYLALNEWGLAKGLVQLAQLLSSSLSVLLTMIFLTAYFLAGADDFFDYQVLIAAPLVFLLSVSNIKSAILRGLSLPLRASFPGLLVTPIALLLTINILTKTGGLTISGAILANIFAVLLTLLLLFLCFPKSVRDRFNSADSVMPLREWRSSLPSYSGIVLVSYFNIEFIVLFTGVFSTTTELALYRVAASLSMIVALPLMSVELIVAPIITKHYFKDDLKSIQSYTQISSAVSFAGSIVPATILFFYGEFLIKSLYGLEYVNAYKPMLLVIIGYVLSSMVGLSMLLLYSTRYQEAALKIAAIGAVMTISICLIFIPIYGSLGAAIALGFGKFIRSLMFAYYARKKLGIRTSIVY